MNTELKNLVDTIFAGAKLVTDVVGHSYLSLVMDGMALMSDVPGDVAGFSDLQNEIKALALPANQADLLAYVQGKLGASVPGVKAQAILGALVNLVTAGIALETAIVS